MAIATLIMSWLYSCMVLVDTNFYKTMCTDCSIRVYWFFNLSGNMKQAFAKGYPALYHSILLYFISSMHSHNLLKSVPIKATFPPAFSSYHFSNFAGKINAYLGLISMQYYFLNVVLQHNYYTTLHNVYIPNVHQLEIMYWSELRTQ